jgi:glycine oxidase
MSDTLVIGGGIIGLLTARELVQAGAKVTLVEMGETGRESSWAGGGICSPLYPWRYPDAVTALECWSQQVYPGLCGELVEETRIDPEFTAHGLLILDMEERDQALAWAQRHGSEVEVIDGPRIQEIEPGLGLRPGEALFLPKVASVRNPRLVKALRRALNGRIQLREQEEVLEILTEGGRTQGVRTSKGVIQAERVVVCTGAWTAHLLDQIGRRPTIEPVRGQMILFLAQPGQINHITLYRDRYVIPRRDGRVLIGSTIEHEGFVKATTAEARDSLYQSAIALFPVLKGVLIEQHWSGLRPGSPSGIPYIGAYPGTAGLYVNAGHYTNGVGAGPASARLVADLLLGRAPILDPAPYALEAER